MVRGRKGGGRPRGGVLLVRKSEPMTRVQGGDGIKKFGKTGIGESVRFKGEEFLMGNGRYRVECVGKRHWEERICRNEEKVGGAKVSRDVDEDKPAGVGT
jgi:hypothetical protein